MKKHIYKTSIKRERGELACSAGCGKSGVSKWLNLLLLSLSVFFMTGCSSDEPDYDISVITIGNTEKTEFDEWLEANFVKPYNIIFKYRYEDLESDNNFYVVPSRYDDAVKLAHLVKYLCIDTYSEVAGVDFIREYFPKMFFTIGEWEYQNNGTMILGTAEGGKKILLAGTNYLNTYLSSPQALNTFYLKTIHHEFTHILNQTKPIPNEFQLVTGNGYVADNWSEEPYNTTYLDNGFISDYAQKEYTEDFAEMMSIYITNDAETWDAMLEEATDESADLIRQKLDIVKNYMVTSFGIDLDNLRKVLQRRQNEVFAGKVNLDDLTIY